MLAARAGLPSEALVDAPPWRSIISKPWRHTGYIAAMQAIARINEKDCN
jgi:hypothetical protein